MSQRTEAKHKRPVPPPAFKKWHEAHCPRLKQEPGELCDGVSVWWVDCRNMTCLELWEEA